MRYVLFMLLLTAFPLFGQDWKVYYDKVENLSDGNFLVKRFEKFGIVDKEGNHVIPIEHDSIFVFPSFYLGGTYYASDSALGDLKCYNTKGQKIYEGAETDFFQYVPSNMENPDRLPLLQIRGFAYRKSDGKVLEIPGVSSILELSSLIIGMKTEEQRERICFYDSNGIVLQNTECYEAFAISVPKWKEKITDSRPEGEPKNVLWLQGGDSLHCISANTGKSIWSGIPDKIIICEKGFELVLAGTLLYIIDHSLNKATLFRDDVSNLGSYLGFGYFSVNLQSELYTWTIFDFNGKELPKIKEVLNIYPLELVENYSLSQMPDSLKNISGWIIVDKLVGTYLYSLKDNIEIYLKQKGNYQALAVTKGYIALVYAKDKSIYSGTKIDAFIWVNKLAATVEWHTSYADLFLDVKNSIPEKNIWILEERNESYRSCIFISELGKKEYSSFYRCKKVSNKKPWFILDGSSGSTFVYDAVRGREMFRNVDADRIFAFGSLEKTYFGYSKNNQTYISDSTEKVLRILPYKFYEPISYVKDGEAIELCPYFACDISPGNSSGMRTFVTDEKGSQFVPPFDGMIQTIYNYGGNFIFLTDFQGDKYKSYVLTNRSLKVLASVTSHVDHDSIMFIRGAEGVEVVINLYNSKVFKIEKNQKFSKVHLSVFSIIDKIATKNRVTIFNEADFTPRCQFYLEKKNLNSVYHVDENCNIEYGGAFAFLLQKGKRFVTGMKYELIYIDTEGNCVENCKHFTAGKK